MQGRRVVDFLHRVEQHIAFQRNVAHPDQVGFGVLDARGNRAKIAVAKIPLQKQNLLQAAFFGDFARTQGHEVNRRELAGHKRHGLGCLAG